MSTDVWRHLCLQMSGDICMSACKLHKHQWVSSGLSHLIKRVVWARCGRRKSLGRYSAENCWRKRQQTLKNDRCEKARKETRRFLHDIVLFKSFFWNRRPDGIVINKNHRTLYILEFKRSSDRNKDCLRKKEDEANEQHRASSRRWKWLPWNGRLNR